MPHSNNMSRRIDFHDTELFLEIEHPKTAQIVVIRCSRPENTESQLVIDIDKLEPGAAVEVDTGESLREYRVMFLTKTNNMGIDQWWECIWKKSIGEEVWWQNQVRTIFELKVLRLCGSLLTPCVHLEP